MATFTKVLGYNADKKTYNNLACDSNGILNVNISTNQIGSKENVHSGTLAAQSSTEHFNVSSYGLNSVLTYEDTELTCSNTISVFATSSLSDALDTGVCIGVLTPIANIDKRYASTKLNIAPFNYLWVRNDSATINVTASVSVYSA